MDKEYIDKDLAERIFIALLSIGGEPDEGPLNETAMVFLAKTAMAAAVVFRRELAQQDRQGKVRLRSI